MPSHSILGIYFPESANSVETIFKLLLMITVILNKNIDMLFFIWLNLR